MYIILAILMFGVLIAVHELGHFIAAKACGVRVEEFAIGMGPALLKKQGKETLYALRLLPIGGYCAMAGEDEAMDDPRAFTSQAPWKRVIILAAGATMNFLIGLVLIFIVYSGAEAFSTPVVTEFFDGCPYESADGLQAGDRFYSIDGHRIYFSSNVTTYLTRHGTTHDVVVIRDGEKVSLEGFRLEPLEYEGMEGKYFGFRFTDTEDATLGVKLRNTWYCALDFVRMVYMSLGDLIGGAVGVKDLSGPVGIVSLMNDVGKESANTADALLNICYLAGFIAVNLAVMNLLPIPALDGGRIFLLLVTILIEAVTRRKLDPKYEGYIHTAGMVLLLMLMAYVMWNDIVRVIVPLLRKLLLWIRSVL